MPSQLNALVLETKPKLQGREWADCSRPVSVLPAGLPEAAGEQLWSCNNEAFRLFPGLSRPPASEQEPPGARFHGQHTSPSCSGQSTVQAGGCCIPEHPSCRLPAVEQKEGRKSALRGRQCKTSTADLKKQTTENIYKK